MKKIFSVNTKLYKVTGVEKVMMDVHHAVQGNYDAWIVGTIPYDRVRTELGISASEYIKFYNPFMFRNSIVVVHERKLLILFWILNNILFQKIKVVYIHHNIFFDHKKTTILPDTIVAIADKGIENLTDFFCAKRENIHKIYNCVKDTHPINHPIPDNQNITLLYPARINAQKQQIKIVEELRGKLDIRIKIKFAGEGPDFEKLKILVAGDEQFEVLGFRSDINELLLQSDYIMLYSAHEGLPVTLIEATMIGTPIICSNVGGNTEICHSGENGWVVNDWDALISTINNLPYISEDEYKLMSKRSRTIYEKEFTYERFKNRYLELLSSL